MTRIQSHEGAGIASLAGDKALVFVALELEFYESCLITSMEFLLGTITLSILHNSSGRSLAFLFLTGEFQRCWTIWLCGSSVCSGVGSDKVAFQHNSYFNHLQYTVDHSVGMAAKATFRCVRQLIAEPLSTSGGSCAGQSFYCSLLTSDFMIQAFRQCYELNLP